MLLPVRIHPMPTKTKAAPEPITEEPEIIEEPQEQGDWEIDDSADYGAAACPAPESSEPVQLTGEELLAFYNEKQQAGRSHVEIAYDAGYYTVTKAGQERVTKAKFNAALLEAKGVDTGDKSAGCGRSHAGLTKARVSGQGILLVSQLATRNVGAEPGAVFEVIYPGDGQILLAPTGEVKPVVPRKGKSAEEPGAPLFDQAGE
jgi:hypothetical protein